MGKDYQEIWMKWIGFLQSDLKIRKEVLDALHIEIRQGFAVISKTSLEELSSQLSTKTFFHELKNDIDPTLFYCVWAGYILYLITKEIDPVENNLLARSQTNELGNIWMDAYEKDRCASLLLEIDPILIFMLQNIAQSECHQLISQSAHKQTISYTDANQILSFFQWAICQGFIFGLIEQQLFMNQEVEK